LPCHASYLAKKQTFFIGHGYESSISGETCFGANAVDLLRFTVGLDVLCNLLVRLTVCCMTPTCCELVVTGYMQLQPKLF